MLYLFTIHIDKNYLLLKISFTNLFQFKSILILLPRIQIWSAILHPVCYWNSDWIQFRMMLIFDVEF